MVAVAAARLPSGLQLEDQGDTNTPQLAGVVLEQCRINFRALFFLPWSLRREEKRRGDLTRDNARDGPSSLPLFVCFLLPPPPCSFWCKPKRSGYCHQIALPVLH